MELSFKKILIANRGEIACRLIKTCHNLNIKTVAIYSDADIASSHVIMATQSVRVGSSRVTDSYLNRKLIIQACVDTEASAVLPGYGFLSTDLEFAKLCQENNVIFIGPTIENIIRFAHKDKALEFASELGIPTVDRSPLLFQMDDALEYADKISYPIIIKSTAGGGGIGMTRCNTEEDVSSEFEKVMHLSKENFGFEGVYIEKFIESARHIEVQVFGKNDGKVLCLGERECSVQRRFQKLIEETPSPAVRQDLRAQIFSSAIKMCESAGYRSVGTVEFIFDNETCNFYFMEINTRLQVEHAVTEMVCGIDLVEWMIKLADDRYPTGFLDMFVNKPDGHAIECRIYAEDPVNEFIPCTGTIVSVSLPKYPWLRYDDWIVPGTEVTQFYDPLLMKVIVHAKTRPHAINRMTSVLDKIKLNGILSNKEYLSSLMKSSQFRNGETHTNMCKTFRYTAPFLEVVKSGMFSTLQNWPGRVGYWKIGVPPSGPLDNLSLRLANKIVGNKESACGIEMTIHGMVFRTHQNCTIAVTGAPTSIFRNENVVQQYCPIQLIKGDHLRIGDTISHGIRIYLAVAGGFDIPDYLGSPSSFLLGKFGGINGRALAAGDMIPITPKSVLASNSHYVQQTYFPKCSSKWTVAVIYGPHGAPDFFTDEYMSIFWTSYWRVHHNSNRLGIRLTGPTPKWSRTDGGEAGLHPSNIHDCEYVIGSVNFTGNHPVILGVDGPSLGGFVCPVVVVRSEMWKLGQMKPGDTVQFVRISHDAAKRFRFRQNTFVENFGLKGNDSNSDIMETQKQNDEGDYKFDAILRRLPRSRNIPEITIRAQGDTAVLVEYGDIVLDFDLRLYVFLFMEWISLYQQNHTSCGLLEVSPAVRSVQIQYNSLRIDIAAVVDIIIQCPYGSIDSLVIPCRRIRLPLAYDDRWCKDAVTRYTTTCKSQTPYLPSNIDFVARINGLKNGKEVLDIILKSTYLVMGLGDVYLNAPCAVPINPCHRLVTSKYSPARTFTPEGAVGLGGAYLCIYGMESPGGYQLVGRTLPIWNTFANKPNLFNYFDKIEFFRVSDDDLESIRIRQRVGQYNFDIADDVFDVVEYRKLLSDNKIEIDQFYNNQQRAFLDEITIWVEKGMMGDEQKEDIVEEKLIRKVSSNEITIDAKYLEVFGKY